MSASNDRLVELRAMTGVPQEGHSETIIQINDGLQTHTELFDKIRKLREYIPIITQISKIDKRVTNIRQRDDKIQELDLLVVKFVGESKIIKGEITNNKMSSQMRDNMLGRLNEIMGEFLRLSNECKVQIRERSRRQLKLILGDQVDDAKIDRIIDTNQTTEIMKSIMLDNLQDTISIIEERHTDILKLEESVLILRDLFVELQLLVETQGEQLNIIEHRINNSKHHVETAEVELQSAEVYSKKSRKCTCCLLFLCMGVLIAILAPLLSMKMLGKI